MAFAIKGNCMNSANKTLINLLLGLVVAVVVGISTSTARGATIDAGVSIDMTQIGSGEWLSISATDYD